VDRFRIVGGKQLNGTIEVSGAKNAALPEIAAALLSAEPVVLTNVPDLHDIHSMIELLEHLGAEIQWQGKRMEINAAKIATHDAPYDLVRKMRASILVLGPLLARTGFARVSLPGGCAIGARPVDLHIDAMQRLGATIEQEHGYINANAGKRLAGGEIVFEKVTVTGTENALMAAVLAEGSTEMKNCAMEPEVVDLGIMLQNMGAQITGLGTATIQVEGVDKLHGVEHEIIPDRIEAGTYLVAGLITGGAVKIDKCRPDDMTAMLEKFRDCGAVLEVGEDYVLSSADTKLISQDVRTMPHPGFPTDMQAQFVALMTQAEGRSAVHETIFENRFMHVPELQRMGADISLDGHTAIIQGKLPLSGASIMATDLRASASLVLAALVVSDETIINRVYHIDRGYSHIVSHLRRIGAEIERIHE
jgi:UDP-N-acetylglucosamine 1-carboxyvinyltransferase